MFSPHDFTVLASPQTAAWSCVRLGLVWTRSLRPQLRARGLVRPSARFPDALSVRRGQTQQTAPLRAPLRAFAHAEHARLLAVQMEETRHRHRPRSPLRPSWSPLPQGHRRAHAQPRGSVLLVLRFQRWIRHAACAPCAGPSAPQRPPRERVSIARSSADGHPVCFWFGTIKKKAQW